MARNILILSILLLQMSDGTLFMSHAAAKPPKFPAVLVFGDSTVDSGNNNYITTVFQSNHQPYGVEFINGTATGRFSDGRLVPDMLASWLGIKQLVPPFLDPSLSNDEILTGVCFASAGSGFDDLTTRVTRVISISQQVAMFQQYISKLKGIVGNQQEASKIINEALILMSGGTNDFLFNFYDLPTRRSAYNYSISEYQDFLLGKLQGMIKEIYDLGGRKFAIAGLAPIGCVPFQISVMGSSSNRTCLDEQNSDAAIYNSKLQKLLTETQATLPGGKLAYINLYETALDMLNNPQKYSFEETLKGCCGTGLVEMGPMCNKWTSHCKDRSKFLFWDAVHPSEAAYLPIAKYILDKVIPQLY